VLDQPGAFGKSLSTRGLNENTIAVGDVFRLGSPTIAVSQGRLGGL
jgi:MOSC domain-containing protein YiiM